MISDQASRLRLARVAAGFTQQTLAKRMNISLSTYRGWETPDGSEPNTLAKLIQLCQILDISIDWLLTGDKQYRITAQQKEAISNLVIAFDLPHSKKMQKSLQNNKSQYRSI
ncbi:helix-turn-helix domain-containing protein [Oceanospirillum beijerinckii]|uniref:helix-turn-helix domain-containing protein n=1 Tax=Oceanospirillum beijerinckii TaxID=64976 RepID=UPI000419DCCC|nr:helix-turn-helix transcriptional regulator [Oceanospirillum beijerinckii]